jgi:hypothetical protein
MNIIFEIKFDEVLSGKLHHCKTHFSGNFSSIQEGKEYVLDFLGFNERNTNLTLLSIQPINL